VTWSSWRGPGGSGSSPRRRSASGSRCRGSRPTHACAGSSGAGCSARRANTSRSPARSSSPARATNCSAGSAEIQREHEAAIVWLATQLERNTDPAARVLTERECRQLEARDHGRYSVEVADGGRSGRRWPDLVVEAPGGRRAIEIEFAPKGTRRLRAIVEAYEFTSPYAQVLFLVKSAALGRRIRAQADGYRPLGAHLKLKLAEVHVEPWPGLPLLQRAAISEALARKTS
jgi:hypothetical protein